MRRSVLFTLFVNKLTTVSFVWILTNLWDIEMMRRSILFAHQRLCRGSVCVCVCERERERERKWLSDVTHRDLSMYIQSTNGQLLALHIKCQWCIGSCKKSKWTFQNRGVHLSKGTYPCIPAYDGVATISRLLKMISLFAGYRLFYRALFSW